MNEAQEEYFLATTALEEFWDTSKPIVFLGEWCLLYERRIYWEALDGKLMNCPYTEANATGETYTYTNRIYEQVLPQLSEALNAIHGKGYSVRHWRILIGPWLQLYISIVYDRYVYIKYSLEHYPSFTTIGLSEKSFVVPSDTLDFVCFASGDVYNLQLYTKLLKVLGKVFTSKEAEKPRNYVYDKLHLKNWKSKIFKFVVKTCIEINTKFSKAIFFKSTYFTAQVLMKLAAENIGRILPAVNQVTPPSRFVCDIEKRNALRYIKIEEAEFEQCLSAMLYEDIPQSFIEGFQAAENNAEKSYPRQVKAVFSANSWYYDELFKQWAAISSDAGVLLLGTQHGGIYGGMKHMPSEDHETAIVDFYYSWGWERKDCTAKVIPLPATKLIGRGKEGADNSKDGILWVATIAPRYHLIETPSLPKNFRDYLQWQKRFVDSLSPEVLREVRFRPHCEDHGWGIERRLTDCMPDIPIESWDVPFQASMKRCRLYVCDHLATTFAEALAANKPTILFCNPRTNPLRPEAQPYFDLLKNGGILFDEPEAAAMAVTVIYKDVEIWWNLPQRQEVIRIFCERFARTSTDDIALWSKELRRVSNLSNS